MSRLIDVDALKDWLEIVPLTGDGGVDINDLVEHIDLMPTAREWIPCSERTPKNERSLNTNGIYIVTRRISDGFECQNITDACYFDGSNTWHDDTRVNHERKYLADVLAWMPLPEPYKEGEQDG